MLESAFRFPFSQLAKYGLTASRLAVNFTAPFALFKVMKSLPARNPGWVLVCFLASAAAVVIPWRSTAKGAVI